MPTKPFVFPFSKFRPLPRFGDFSILRLTFGSLRAIMEMKNFFEVLQSENRCYFVIRLNYFFLFVVGYNLNFYNIFL